MTTTAIRCSIVRITSSWRSRDMMASTTYQLQQQHSSCSRSSGHIERCCNRVPLTETRGLCVCVTAPSTQEFVPRGLQLAAVVKVIWLTRSDRSVTLADDPETRTNRLTGQRGCGGRYCDGLAREQHDTILSTSYNIYALEVFILMNV